MDIDEYCWRNRMSLRKLAIKVGCTEASILKYKHGKGSPSLLIAMKIVKTSGGDITLEELLGKNDKEKLKKWLES